MDAMKEELNHLKKQCYDLLKERDTALAERDVLKQQCTKAIRQWNLIVQQRNDLKEILKKEEFEHQETIKELKNVIANNSEIKEALNKERIIRNNTYQEYKLVMSERDIVHNDIEKLTTDLSIQISKNKVLAREIRTCKNEIKPLKWQVECFKRELSTILRERDQAFKKCNKYQQKYEEITTKNKHQSDDECQLNDDISREEQNQNDSPQETTSLSLFSSCENKRFDNLDEANEEIESLRKLVAQNYTELNRLQDEAKISEKRRDWAFEERDKIMLERERFRGVSDTLRKQLHETIKLLALSFKEVEDRIQRKHYCIVENKEKIEAQLEKEIRLLQLQATNFSTENTAIDLQNRDTEILNIYLDFSDLNEDIGIGLHGGKDEPLCPNDNAIYVSSINKGSLAANKLRVNDCILRVNNLDCSLVNKQLVLETMRTLSRANLIVRRKKQVSPSKSIFTTRLFGNNCDHGISLESGVYINKIIPGSVAAKDGNLNVGDRVLSINNISLNNINSAREAMLLLSANVLTISTLKSTHCGKYCGTGHNQGYKKYINNTSQTDTPVYSTNQESYHTLQYVQSRQVMQGVLEKPQRNPSLVNNNDISEHDQRGAVAGSVIDIFKSHSESTTSDTIFTTIKHFM